MLHGAPMAAEVIVISEPMRCDHQLSWFCVITKKLLKARIMNSDGVKDYLQTPSLMGVRRWN